MSRTVPTLDDETVAIAHDQLCAHGGAEEVAFEMARTFDAPIYAAAVDEDVVPDDIEAIDIVDRWVGKRAMRSHYLLQDLFQMVRWQHVDPLYDYDVVIENKTNPWWFVPEDDQTVVRYVHSPPRGMYDQFTKHGGYLPSDAIKTPMRTLFAQTLPYADGWVCNSDLVQQRTQSYLGIPMDESEVIYPPVRTETYGPQHADGEEDYYFTFSRLRGHKCINEIVAAFNQLGDGFELVVGGDGPEREALEEQANDNVELVGYLSEEEKRRRLAECKGFVFAAENEDFGIVPIEAMASGTAVIGVKEGFTQHQIIRGKNGITWPRAGGHLREAIRLFDSEGVDWTGAEIADWADEHFNAQRFRDELSAAVAEARECARVDPWDVDTPEVGRVGVTARTDGGER